MGKTAEIGDNDAIVAEPTGRGTRDEPMTCENSASLRIAPLRRGEPVSRIGTAILGALLMCSAAAPLPASTGETPAGTWTTIDDASGKARALVEIKEQDGALSGRIVRLFRDPGEDPAPLCKSCDGERHDQPVIGMTILWNLRRHGDVWSGGEILDPETGSIYRCYLHTVANGNKLELRGYIGFSLLGRTQTWERAAEP